MGGNPTVVLLWMRLGVDKSLLGDRVSLGVVVTASGPSCSNDLISAETSALQRGARRHGAVHRRELGQAEVAEHVKGRGS